MIDKVGSAHDRRQAMDRRRALTQVSVAMLLDGLPPADSLLGPNWAR